MTFYQELQLSSTGSKQLIKNTTDKKEKRRHIVFFPFFFLLFNICDFYSFCSFKNTSILPL